MLEKTIKSEEDLSIDEISTILSKSFEEITDLLKAIASPKRLSILNFLLQKPRNFSFLLNNLAIKRTTLVHHLDFLMDMNLIEREDWGRYKITVRGFKIITAITKTYQNLIIERQKEQKQILDKYNQWPQFYKESRVFNERIVNNYAHYQGGWNCYVSSVSGILASLGDDHDYIYVSGRSGYCFIVLDTHLVTASILSKSAWDEIYKGTESFGWKMNIWKKKRQYSGVWQLENEDYDVGLNIFNQICKIIDDYNTPVVLLGVHGNGFAIVNGYQNDSYLVSTYYHIEGRKEIPIRFDQLHLINKFIYFYFTKEKKTIIPEVEDKKSIKRAIEFARGDFFSQSEFTSGPEAYDKWIHVLESGKKDQIINFGNGNLGQFYFDSKYIASEYLERLSRIYLDKPQSKFLKNASQSYRNAKMKLDHFTVMFPHPQQQQNINITLEKRKKGITILNKVKSFEIEAIEGLKQAYEKWKS
ncbi:MAG: winged helix-turn-helix transcriptional regulator [Candidatus Lokiarchaeota archaeon]|nr:winged helix-turn-helix transcriptional regulator [Candidatus Lokiarchaeota archaeon]